MTQQLDINDIDRITRSFSRRELRRISRVSGALDRALARSRRAFEACGECDADRPDLSTTFVAVITPARLEATLADLERLGAFWRAQWQQTTDRQRSRIFRSASDAIAKALSLVQPWLDELDAAVIEQHTLGMPATRLLPAAERERARLRAQPATTPITPDQRRDLLDALRRAVRPHGGVVNRAVLDGICDLAERGDVQAIYQLRRIKEIIRAN